MVLKINTSDRKKIEVSLSENGEISVLKSAENEFGSQVLLELITEILKENHLEYSDLSGIQVEKGPGSFTGLKVGASVANALGFALSVPVNGKDSETELKYS